LDCLPEVGIGGLNNIIISEDFYFLSYGAAVICYMNIHCKKAPYNSVLAVFADSDFPDSDSSLTEIDSRPPLQA
jgi:hypothetical protein